MAIWSIAGAFLPISVSTTFTRVGALAVPAPPGLVASAVIVSPATRAGVVEVPLLPRVVASAVITRGGDPSPVAAEPLPVMPMPAGPRAGAIMLDDIQSADWSLMLDASTTTQMSGGGIGAVVQGIADINQCIGIILTTPKGSDPLRPTFACDLWRWIDAPVTVARPNLVREIVEAITRWEPRVRVLSVTVDLVGVSQLSIRIVWQLKVDVAGAGNQQVTITVPRNLV